MKAWLLDGLGGVDKLRLGEAADPTAGDGEVVMRVRYAALNPADRYLAEGQYPARPAFPHILGRDAVGTIESVGPGVRDWRMGDRALLLRSEIGVNRHGTFAQKVAIPVESLVKPPSGWSEEQSAGAPLVYLTAYQALTEFGDLPPGQVVLVTGASGGVGNYAIQIARHGGATVTGPAASASRRSNSPPRWATA